MNTDRQTNRSEPWEHELSRELSARVRHLHDAPLTLEDVKGSAMTIRRRRRIAVAGGVLAAAAVIVPVAVFGVGHPGRTDRSPDVATRSPSPTQATEPPAGSLGVSYLEGTTWRRPDGSTVQLGARYGGGTELGDDLLAVRNDDGQLTIDVIAPDGTVSDSFGTVTYPVTNAEHTTVASVTADGNLITRWADGQVALADGLDGDDTVAAVVGGPDCTEGGGCRVFINHGDLRPAEVLDSRANRTEVVPQAVKVNDATPGGLLAAQLNYSDTGSCSAVYDEQAAASLFETCEYSFDDFSPDSSYLSGSDAYRDGFGQTRVMILDATTGREVARWRGDGGSAVVWVWEDADHLLINAYERGEWRVYRLGVDGSTKRVLSSSEGDEFTPAFALLDVS